MTLAKTSRKSSLIRYGLFGFLLIGTLTEPGCSQFQARRKAAHQKVAAFGTDSPDRDIYVKDPSPSSELLSARESSKPSNSGPFAASTNADLSNSIAPSSDPVVQLQRPTPVDVLATRTTSPTAPGTTPSQLISRSPARGQSRSDSQPSRIATPAQVVADARIALDAMTTYQLSLRRQERVNDTLLPVEDLVMSIRRSPKATRLSWVSGQHQGREVLYRADEPGGLMHVNMADSKIPMPRLALAPDSPMVMKNSRHPITEAGLDPLVASMEEAARSRELEDLGMQTVPQLDRPHHGLLRRTASGDIWRAYFDSVNHLPALVECQAQNGDLLERYEFRNILPNPLELASADAFDPTSRWGPPRGFLGRMSAKAGDSGSPATPR